MQVKPRYLKPDAMGLEPRSRTKGLLDGDCREDPVFTKLGLRAWALWRMELQPGWLDSPVRAGHFQMEVESLRKDIIASNAFHNVAAKNEILSWARKHFRDML